MASERKRDPEIRCLKLVMSKDKYDFIMQAFEKIRQESGHDISDSRALEFICAEYLNKC